MSVGAKGEDLSDIFPHVASVAAAYGDPKGKYSGFLQKNAKDYQSQPFWYYDQSAALPNSPAGKSKRSESGVTENTGTEARNSTNDSIPVMSQSTTSIPFECPAVFRDAPAVELEDGLFVTCDELRPFFEIPSSIDTSM
jgi:hypothetical protein